MALISKAKGDPNGGGYTRLVGDRDLGALLSRVHSAVITAGNELEKIITASSRTIDDLDQFLASSLAEDGVWVFPKKTLKQSKLLKQKAGSRIIPEPDFLVLEHRDNQKHAYVIELKDGTYFDTKKSAGEAKNLSDFVDILGAAIQYTAEFRFCSFNQDDPKKIVEGLKNKISLDKAMTGKDFCGLVKIDYNVILQQRQQDQAQNLSYFVETVLSISVIRDMIMQKLLEKSTA